MSLIDQIKLDVIDQVLKNRGTAFVRDCSDSDIDKILNHIYYKALVLKAYESYGNYSFMVPNDVLDIIMNITNNPKCLLRYDLDFTGMAQIGLKNEGFKQLNK